MHGVAATTVAGLQAGLEVIARRLIESYVGLSIRWITWRAIWKMASTHSTRSSAICGGDGDRRAEEGGGSPIENLEKDARGGTAGRFGCSS